MIEKALSIQIDIESMEIKSLFFIVGIIDRINIYDMKNDE